MRTLTCSPTVETLGAPMLSFIENMEAETIYPYLEQYGLTQIAPNQWYPLQTWLNVLNDMAQGTNLTSNLVAIGLEIIGNVVMPPELERASFPTVLNQWDAIYQMQHRGGDIGHVVVDKVSETHFKTTHNLPYPDDMIYGVGYGMARRYLPRGTQFKVYYDEKEPHLDEGGKRTVIHIKW
ncbi:MAG: hypothetical protein GC204_15230 [Chloroflexi bacterium]|nr:hypothetical protein [Chloroflexota bacterium]